MNIGSCSANSNLNGLLLLVLFVIAIIFLAVLSMFTRRSSFKLELLNGRPGPIVPLNLLDGYENRFATSLAFAVAASYFIQAILDIRDILGTDMKRTMNSLPGYVNVFFKMIAAIFLAIVEYPLFVCLGKRRQIYFSVFGLIYTIVWFSMLCYNIERIFDECKELKVWYLLQNLPQLICLPLLVGHFTKMIFIFWRDRSRFYNESEQPYLRESHFKFRYVAKLLNGKYEAKKAEYKFLHSRLAAILDWFYPWQPEFKFSTRITCTYTVCVVALYWLSILCWIRANIEFDCESHFPHSPYCGTIFRCLNAAVCLAVVKSCFVLLNMLYWHRLNLTRLRLGDRSWLPVKLQSLQNSPISITISSMKYAGYQIAYVVWGFFVAVLLVFAFLFIVVLLAEKGYLRRLITSCWPYAPILSIVFILQRLLGKYVFVLKKDGMVTITNRKAFNITSYFFFFFNALLGMLTVFRRFIIALSLGTVFFERVQASVLPRSFEVFDPGFRAYIGYLQIEHSFGNPIQSIFICLLKNSIEGNLQYSALRTVSFDRDFSSINAKNSVKRSRTIRNRWFVAYTLIKNPALASFRKKINREFLVDKELKPVVMCIPDEELEVDDILVTI